MRVHSLIPAPTRTARRRESHRRGWIVLCAVLTLIGGAVTLVSRAIIVSPDAATIGDIAQASAAHETLVVRQQEMIAFAASADKTRRAALRAANHPDWSILLAFISDLCADSVTLVTFKLEPAPDGSGFDVLIDGIGASQPDVARFVLGLERSGVFRTTKLNSAGRASGDGIAFSATCLIRPGGARASAPTNPATPETLP